MANLATGGTTTLLHGAPCGVVQSITIDFSKNPLGAGETHAIFNIPAGTFVAKLSVNVTKADTGASTRTFDIGDGDDPDGWADGVNAKSVARSILAPALTEAAPNTITGFSVSGKFYASADTIDFKAVESLSNAIVEVKVLCFAM